VTRGRRAVLALALAPVALGGCETAPRAGATEPAPAGGSTEPAAWSVPSPAAADSAGSAAAPAGSPPAPAAVPPAGDVPFGLVKQRAPHDFSNGPLYFTPAYDGSLRFSLWIETMRFARRMEDKHGKRPRFTFFVNGAFYATGDFPTDVGRATTRAEILVRRALTQQAINEGHDVGNHGMGHLEGRAWTEAEWTAELDRFHAAMDGTLFEPIRDADGTFVFPRWTPLDGAAAGATGSACEADADCTSGACVELGHVKVCTEPCNIKRRCPKGTACGAPMFRDDTDLCLPPPAFPVFFEGDKLFDAHGNANPKSKRLVRYRIHGFRAPYLAVNDALYAALVRRGYTYDTSQATSPPEPPYTLTPPGEKTGILELALMPHPGALAIPMDYNYRREGGSPERMLGDYLAALEASHADGRRPWNVGHHFAAWGEGTYKSALETAVEHALAGCPDDRGEARCPGAEVISFRELAKIAASR
jgi:peptidoglycan/xylan/chitin deacetylase (PgdA/CDA1 family)